MKFIKNMIISESREVSSDIIKFAKQYLIIKAKYTLCNYFCFDRDMVTALALIKRLDKNYSRHATPQQGAADLYLGTYVIPLKHSTFIIIHGTLAKKKETGEITGYTIELYVFGRGKNVVSRKISNFLKRQHSRINGIITISGPSSKEYMFDCTKKDMVRRTFDTLYFDADISKEIKDHIDRWKANKAIYEDRGLIHKTGILIHGIRGTGKSTLALAIASYLNCDIINIDIPTFDDIQLAEVTNAINLDNTTYVVLLDEVDAIFKSRDDEDISPEQVERTNKLLSFLDGPISPNGVIFVATTNYYDRLDPAIKRKGRFDKEIEIGNMNRSTALRMCKGFKLTNEQAEEVLSYFGESINPADLQDKILEVIRPIDYLEDEINGDIEQDESPDNTDEGEIEHESFITGPDEDGKFSTESGFVFKKGKGNNSVGELLPLIIRTSNGIEWDAIEVNKKIYLIYHKPHTERWIIVVDDIVMIFDRTEVAFEKLFEHIRTHSVDTDKLHWRDGSVGCMSGQFIEHNKNITYKIYTNDSRSWLEEILYTIVGSELYNIHITTTGSVSYWVYLMKLVDADQDPICIDQTYEEYICDIVEDNFILHRFRLDASLLKDDCAVKICQIIYDDLAKRGLDITEINLSLIGEGRPQT